MPILKRQKAGFEGDGIIIFRDVAGAMKGERIIKGFGYDVMLVAPPENCAWAAIWRWRSIW